MDYYVIGVDPGPVTGIVQLHLDIHQPKIPSKLLGAEAVQATPGMVVPVLRVAGLLSTCSLAVEAFVVSTRAGRSSTPTGGQVARDMVALLDKWAASNNVPLYSRRATDVKPWATDERLDAAGLLEPTKGMRHARDAARHALFTAVRVYGLPDPLSRKGRAA